MIVINFLMFICLFIMSLLIVKIHNDSCLVVIHGICIKSLFACLINNTTNNHKEYVNQKPGQQIPHSQLYSYLMEIQFLLTIGVNTHDAALCYDAHHKYYCCICVIVQHCHIAHFRQNVRYHIHVSNGSQKNTGKEAELTIQATNKQCTSDSR